MTLPPNKPMDLTTCLPAHTSQPAVPCPLWAVRATTFFDERLHPN